MLSDGKILVVEFSDSENSVFDEIMNMLNKNSDIKRYEMPCNSVLSFPGLEVHLDRRKVYCDKQEVYLTAKEYEPSTIGWLILFPTTFILRFNIIYRHLLFK